jgi:hypothetical protein
MAAFDQIIRDWQANLADADQADRIHERNLIMNLRTPLRVLRARYAISTV